MKILINGMTHLICILNKLFFYFPVFLKVQVLQVHRILKHLIGQQIMSRTIVSGVKIHLQELQHTIVRVSSDILIDGGVSIASKHKSQFLFV